VRIRGLSHIIDRDGGSTVTAEWRASGPLLKKRQGKAQGPRTQPGSECFLREAPRLEPGTD